MSHMKYKDQWSISLTADQVLRSQGSDPEIIKTRKPQLYKIAEWAIKEGTPLLDPKIIFESYQVNRLIHQKLELHGQNENRRYYLSGGLIANHLAGADNIIVLICTIGSTLERMAAELMGTDPLYGWALDSFGSASVESLATQAGNMIESQAYQRGKKSSIPLSPGMIGWPVRRGQTEIFKLIDPSPIGVTLNQDFQMQPAKTLSLIIGTGAQIMNQGETCDYCAMNTTCQYQNLCMEKTGQIEHRNTSNQSPI